MDLLQEIRKKVKLDESLSTSEGIQAVITHIERAESFLAIGRRDDDINYFTDVIYRTNHAFEGILKEAYTIMSNKVGDRKTPADIEKYFASESVFQERILRMFQDYRQQWRNPSTHDYKLFFNEDEAFMAIVTVSAFVNILLNQLYEKISYNQEKMNLSQAQKSIISKIPGFGGMDFFNKVESVVLQFANEIGKSINFSSTLKEYQLIGMLTAYLENTGIAENIERDYAFTDNNNVQLRPDLLISGEEDIFLEVKLSRNSKTEKTFESQMMLYLHHSKVKRGILLLLSEKPEVQYDTEFTAYDMKSAMGDDIFGISKIYRKEQKDIDSPPKRTKKNG